MPDAARFVIATALVFLGLGLASGIYLAGGQVFGWFVPYTLPSAHAHLLLVGAAPLLVVGFVLPRRVNLKNFSRAWWWVFALSYLMLTSASLVRFLFEVSNGIYSIPLFQLGSFWAGAAQVAALAGLVAAVMIPGHRQAPDHS